MARNFQCVNCMKKLIYHIAIISLLFSMSLFSQEVKTNSNEEKQTTEKSAESKETSTESSKEEVQTLIDKNLNGIDDRIENSKNEGVEGNLQTRKRSREHFKDEDGDGINDNRCKGLGLGKGMGKKAGKRKK